MKTEENSFHCRLIFRLKLSLYTAFITNLCAADINDYDCLGL